MNTSNYDVCVCRRVFLFVDWHKSGTKFVVVVALIFIWGKYFLHHFLMRWMIAVSSWLQIWSISTYAAHTDEKYLRPQHNPLSCVYQQCGKGLGDLSSNKIFPEEVIQKAFLLVYIEYYPNWKICGVEIMTLVFFIQGLSTQRHLA